MSFSFNSILSCSEILTKTCSFKQKEQQLVWFGDIQGTCDSSNFRLQGMLDFRMNRLNLGELVNLVHRCL